ncbi:MAG: hypothetical protein GY853_01235 [PVC group bacterium]|nr:hypothetical protein [PVC group bacterium]
MKKNYCDICKREVENYMIRNISYQDDTPQYNGSPAIHKSIEICPTCNEAITNSIERTIKSII